MNVYTPGIRGDKIQENECVLHEVCPIVNQGLFAALAQVIALFTTDTVDYNYYRAQPPGVSGNNAIGHVS